MSKFQNFTHNALDALKGAERARLAQQDNPHTLAEGFHFLTDTLRKAGGIAAHLRVVAAYATDRAGPPMSGLLQDLYSDLAPCMNHAAAASRAFSAAADRLDHIATHTRATTFPL